MTKRFTLCLEYSTRIVPRILDARYNEQRMFQKLLVSWRGIPIGEAIWEPYSVMAVDVSEMVAKL
jgi:hypothetical protein